MRRYAFSLFLCGVVVCGEKSAAATDNLSAFSPQAEEQVKEVPNPEQAARKFSLSPVSMDFLGGRPALSEQSFVTQLQKLVEFANNLASKE